MEIRKANVNDLPEMLDIYNYEVENTNVTFAWSIRSMEEGKKWLFDHNIKNHPMMVAEEDGKVVGYASLSEYRTREAYDSTVELSVYIHRDYRHKGYGEAMMRDLIAQAKADPKTHCIVSVITADNAGSIHLHEKLGFKSCGIIHECGYKFDKYHDTANYEMLV